MCGINGIMSFNNVSNIKLRLSEMNSAILHRGPDSNDIAVLTNNIGFAHVRLSILDLDKRANQPMYSNDKKTLIVFNGEIYNFIEIRGSLLKQYDFKTNSDTEVILAAYQLKGIDWFLKNANGMFAFAIYNTETNELILARDRFGIKPFYYCIENNTLVFSSEIKGILNSGLINSGMNYAAIDEYLGNRYVREPFTFFQNIFQVKSSTYLRFSKNVNFKEFTYWKLPNMNFCDTYNELDVIEETAEKVEKSIKNWFISDVKVGAYLSGGLDSSIMTALLSKYAQKTIDTYTIGFLEKGFNEFEYSRKVALMFHTKHREFTIDANSYLDEIDRLIYFKDAPLGVPNEVPLAIMSTNLSKDITVVISGEGADELFGGYGQIFRSAFDYKNHCQQKQNGFYKYFIEKYEYVPRSIRDKYLSIDSNYREFFDDMYQYDFKNHQNEESIFRFFHSSHIKGLLNRVDMTTMQASVEARPPFLDHELLTHVYEKVPYNLKLKWNNKNAMLIAKKQYANEYSETLDTPKYILKKISEKFLPNDIIYRKKMGFPVPLTNWFDKLQYLSKNELKDADWLKKGTIISLCNELTLTHSNRSGQLLWMFLNIELFKKKYFNKNWQW
ncbi:MAG: asparagine synthase (glutamine-hydrolyzing) [Bacteroidales bacterium]|nr:asparagine synthase (glutamine-hydrolyzing) [Bacteroidales bacterium]